MKILVIGDIIGGPGRDIIKRTLKSLRQEREIDFVIANGENLAGGKGVSREVVRDMFENGVNVLTGGNHIWANKEVFQFINDEPRIVRPANYPENFDIPGKGSGIYSARNGFKIGVINLLGQIFLGNFDSPFIAVQRELEKLQSQTNIIIVDFHAEATSEKVALGWFLAGKVTAVLGTHTHIPTADEAILHSHTAYITDIGMTGPYNSVIGVKKDIIMTAFVKHLPVRHQIAEEDLRLCAVLIDVDTITGAAKSIERIRIDLPNI